MINCKWAAWEEKGAMTYWPTQTVLANTCLLGDAWSCDCPEKMDQSCLSEDEPVWGEDPLSVQSALRKQAQTGDFVFPSSWQTGGGAESQWGGLALQPSPGALGQKGAIETETRLCWWLLMWLERVFLRRRWFIIFPVEYYCRERMRMVALKALWEVKGPKRLSRSHCLPRQGAGILLLPHTLTAF